MHQLTIEIEVRTARRLLTTLLPFGGVVPSDALYRGQGKSSWSLLPSFLRDKEDTRWNCHKMVSEEIELLGAFFDACDRQGLRVPGGYGKISRLLKSYREAPLSHALAPWPPEDLLPAMALAQHHGVPTRLLDWSKNPFVACYFAAIQSLELSNSAEYDTHREDIAIWMFNPSFEHDEATDLRSIWHKLTPAYADNANLRAQYGVLTYSETVIDRGTLFKSKPFDDYVRDSDLTSSNSPFVKFLLNADEALDLLMDLDLLGVSATTLFPGYNGAAKEAVNKVSFMYKDALVFHDRDSAVTSEEWLLDIRERISHSSRQKR